MQQLTFVASVAGLLMLTAFIGIASFFDGAPFDTPLETLYEAPGGRVALRVVN
jgi:hypothetical protein